MARLVDGANLPLLTELDARVGASLLRNEIRASSLRHHT